MADRSVRVVLLAQISQYQAAMVQAKNSTAALGREIADTGNKNRQVWDNIGKGAVVGGAIVAAGFGVAVGAAANFDKAMSEVGAVAGATAGQMDQLRQAALDAGAATEFSASEAAQAQAELVKAGVSVSDVLGGGLTGALDLAAAGSLDLASAATIAAQAMNIFDLQGSDVTHVADLLAAGANKSAADVGMLGDALRQGGLVASQYGLSIEDTVGTLAAFADNALIGSDAGTALKTMLQRLSPISKESAALMAEIGFSAYDLQGNFIGIAGVAEELKDSLAGMNQQQRDTTLAQLFGSDAVRGANVLYEIGAQGVRDYTDAVDDQGAAAEMAGKKLDNLSGDFEALRGSVETALIQGGSKATDALRALTQGATDVVNGFSAMPSLMQTVVGGVAGLAGTASLAGGAFITLAPKIVAARTALGKMDSTLANFAGRNMGKLATGLAGIGAALVVGSYAYERATRSGREYDATVKELAGSLAPVLEGQKGLNQALADFLEMKAEGFSDDQIAGLNALDVSLSDIRRSITAGADALDPLRDAVVAMGIDLEGMDIGKIDDKGASSRAVERLADAMGISKGALKGLIDELEDWDGHAQDASKRTIDLALANGELERSAVDVAYETFRLGDGTINYAAALNSLAPEVDATVDGAAAVTEEMKTEIDALAETEAAAKALAAANEELGDSYGAFTAGTDAYQAVIDRTRTWAEETAAATEDTADSWETFFDGHTVSLGDYLAELDRQVQAQMEWKDNLARIALVAGAEVAEAMATSAAPEEVALLADATDEELRRGAALWMQTATDGGEAMGEALRTELDVMAAIGRLGAEATAQQIAEQLGIGVDAVTWIAASYGIQIEKGISPASRALDVLIYQMAVLDNKARELGQNPLIFGGGSITARDHVVGRTPGATGATGGYVSAAGIDPTYRARGGPIGTDTVPAWLTPGEFVVSASAARKIGYGTLSELNQGNLSAPTGAGSMSYDQSRHTTFQVQPTIYESTSPKATAADVIFEAKVMAAAMGGG